MSCCLECFCESGFSGQSLQKLVDEIHPNFVCESEKCSTFSPGPVVDDERIAFLLIDPLHYDAERSVVVPEAFQELINRDLSTIRIAHASPSEANATREDLIQRGREKIPPKLRLVDEVCIASVSEIRSTADSSGRLLAVYDTGIDNAPAHASVFTRSDVFNERRLRKVVRSRIHELFTKVRIPYNDFQKELR